MLLFQCVICLFFHLFLFKRNPHNKKEAQNDSVWIQLSKTPFTAKIAFSMILHGVQLCPVGVGKVPVTLTCAMLGLREQLQICNSAICNTYQKESPLGLDFGRPLRSTAFSQKIVYKPFWLTQLHFFVLAPNFRTWWALPAA